MGLSLGMSGYSVFGAVGPASSPAPTQVAVPAEVQAVPKQALPTLLPLDRVGTTMYDEPPVGPKSVDARSARAQRTGYFVTLPTLGPVVTSLPPDLAVVAVDAANVRSGPAIASSVINQVKYGTELRIIDMSDGWLEVRLPDQSAGWVAADWVVTAAR
jgi:uncharacterized protein YgiM (DUF1202 family)